MKRSLLSLPAILVLVLAVAISACGGDDDSTGNGTVTATATEADSEGGSRESPTRQPTPTDSGGADNGEVGETPVGASGEDLCELINADEINEITDGGFGEGEETSDSCAFVTSGGDTINVIVQHFPGQADEKFDDIFAGDLLGFEEIGGAGERAAWTNDYNELQILTGDNILVINLFYVASDDDAVMQDQAFAIAEIVLGRL